MRISLHQSTIPELTVQKTTEQEREQWLFVLAFGQASVLEIDSVIKTKGLAASITHANANTTLVQARASDAKILFRALGGCLKFARVLGSSLEEATHNIELPFHTKFNWTVSAYNCKQDLYVDTVASLKDLLKEKNLGKSKFISPEYRIPDSENIVAAELKAADLQRRIFTRGQEEGLDLIVTEPLNDTGHALFAQSVATFDVAGFEERDLGRPYQDPTRTLSPRIARTIVNIALSQGSRSLLDPFCGLGTILQEALLCGQFVVGVDRDRDLVDKARANLDWLATKARIKEIERKRKLFPYDAMRISRARLPKIDAIASEPILLPLFKQNPKSLEAQNLIERARANYEKCLPEFSSILSHKGDRIALVTPVLVDSSGKRVTFDLRDAALRAGLKVYQASSGLKMTAAP